MNILSKLSLFAFISILFISCGDDEDTTPEDNQAPEIVSASIASEEGHDDIKQGEDAHVDVHFTDDQALSEARLDIHSAHDDHNHKLTDEAVALKWDTIISLSGTEHEGHFDVHIPHDALTGSYHFTVELTDQTGNEAEIHVQEFNIASSDEAPASFNITSPDFATATELHACDEFAIEGSVSDEDGIEDIHVSIMAEGDDHAHKLTEVAIFEDHIHAEGATSYTYEDYMITIPCETPEGHYEIVVEVTDMEGFHHTISGELHLQGEH